MSSAHFIFQVEKRNNFRIFLKQFLAVFRNWKPFKLCKTPEETVIVSTVNYTRNIGDVVVGCNFGHPAEVILLLTEEVSRITRFLTDSKLVLC